MIAELEENNRVLEEQRRTLDAEIRAVYKKYIESQADPQLNSLQSSGEVIPHLVDSSDSESEPDKSNTEQHFIGSEDEDDDTLSSLQFIPSSSQANHKSLMFANALDPLIGEFKSVSEFQHYDPCAVSGRATGSGVETDLGGRSSTGDVGPLGSVSASDPVALPGTKLKKNSQST